MRREVKDAAGYLLPEGDSRPYLPPVLVGACLLGIPCRWHGRRPAKRDALLERLKSRFVLVPLCPEQLGGMPTPHTGETLCGGTGADILDGRLRLIAPETGKDVTDFHVKGARYTPETNRQGERLSRQPEGRFPAVLAVPAVFEFRP